MAGKFQKGKLRTLGINSEGIREKIKEIRENLEDQRKFRKLGKLRRLGKMMNIREN